MGVKVELKLDEFEDKFMQAVGLEMVKAGKVFRRNIQTALITEGKSPPASPDGSKIPYADTGNLANQWKASHQAKRTKAKISVAVGTNIMYAKWLVFKTGKGRRNYLDGRLAWRRKTNEMMLKRLDVKRLIASAVRSLKQ
ncbi:MAG: hypothetical protein CL524_08285 [Aequorivita sp.]|nr:hypothetical protein [Aequorivita sp.]|tara:strand:+ start:221 stop:640 length:420 start_codon:yes stop_codon:yes gene_type:complete